MLSSYFGGLQVAGVIRLGQGVQEVQLGVDTIAVLGWAGILSGDTPGEVRVVRYLAEVLDQVQLGSPESYP